MSEAPRPWPRQAPLLVLVAVVLAFGLGLLLGGRDEPTASADAAPTAAEVTWTCSMHPQIRQPEPGSCPICGMDLIPAGDADSDDDGGRVVLSDRARALARIQSTAVRRQADLAAQVQLLGRIEPDERTRRTVTTWIGGRIERLHVNTTGEQVRKGQVIATLYSPEVYAAHQDLLAAGEQVERLSRDGGESLGAARAALQAAQDRLRLLGVPEEQLAQLAQSDTPLTRIDIRSPFAGTVLSRDATEGAYVEVGAALYALADLSRLWVQLDAYESDLARLAVGQTVQIEVEALPGERFEGRVAFIEPTVDAERRTARVRVEVANPEGRLRPGMYAEATVSATAEQGSDSPLVIPATAPLFTGRRSVVYVEVPADADPGGERLAYEARTVRLGPRLGDLYPVVSGLSEGERVVTRGAFAIDADLQIRGGASMMTAPDDHAPAEDAPVPLTAATRTVLAPVLEAYLAVQVALAQDDRAAAATAAQGLVAAVDAVSLDGAAGEAWPAVRDAMLSHARHVAKAADIEGARAGFEPLSLAVEALLRRYGNPLQDPVHVAFCPMAMGSAGARWVQRGTTVDNAYFGASMRTCGELQATVSPGTALSAERAGAPRAAPSIGHAH